MVKESINMPQCILLTLYGYVNNSSDSMMNMVSDINITMKNSLSMSFKGGDISMIIITITECTADHL